MWTEKRVKSLKELWADGLSASRISNRMVGVSRNAVMASDGNGARAQSSHTPLQYQLPLFEAEPVHGENIRSRRLSDQRQAPASKAAKRRIKLLDLQDGMCRWPLGDPNAASFHFCGCQTNDGPYCAHHARLAHQERKRAK
jgi:GcrA cell cycle regulator